MIRYPIKGELTIINSSVENISSNSDKQIIEIVSEDKGIKNRKLSDLNSVHHTLFLDLLQNHNENCLEWSNIPDRFQTQNIQIC